MPGACWLIDRCLQAGSADRLRLKGLKNDRRAVLGGGLSVLYTLATQFGIDPLRPARGALRQGVVFDLAGRQAAPADVAHGSGDLRDDSVRELQQRFRIDITQAERVVRVATGLFKGAQPAATSEAKRELGWAAALHEVGMTISHHDHHRHSGYVLGHVDAAGFSQSQLRRIGDLVLGHRGGVRKIEARLQDSGFVALLLCLRIAVIVCHPRDEVDIASMRLDIDGKSARLQLTAAWARSHPRALHLLGEEIETWTRSGFLSPALVIAQAARPVGAAGVRRAHTLVAVP